MPPPLSALFKRPDSPDSSYSMAMAAPPSTRPYDESVTITLTSARRTQDLTRHIVLHPDEPVIIGRTSRSEFKNLTSSNDNALFDCPVVSRTHAEFSLSFNKWDVKDMYKIYITDKRSMHGTSVNGQKLQPNRRFLLNVGDVIRLGDSVSQGSNSYDGVIISLDCISVASQKKNSLQTTYGARGIARGFGCPSGSDPESDDDSVEEVEAPSSAQTTPDQTTEKPAMKKLANFGSSTLTGIVLDDENELESVAAAPIITARSIVVPDTYDEDALAEIEAAEMERVMYLQGLEDAAAADEQEQEEMDESVYGAQESEVHFSDDDQSQASDDDNTSDAASSHHSFDSESDRISDRMSDFQDDEDETEWAEQNDLHSIHDDQDDDDDEGPETMTSRRTQSVEIGTLGNIHDDHEYQPSDAPPCEPAAPTRPHYDPVRGMFQVAAAPFAEIPSISTDARPARFSKWDVGPSEMTPTLNWHVEALETSTHVSAKNDAPNVTISPTVSDSSKKRKASEISTGLVPMATAPEFQSPLAEDQQSQHPSSVPSEAKQHQLRMDSPVASTASEEALAVEPSPKKLKTCQPRTKKSMLRAAAIEASKYTAGAIIGSIGLVTVLVSPIGEALASC